MNWILLHRAGKSSVVISSRGKIQTKSFRQADVLIQHCTAWWIAWRDWLWPPQLQELKKQQSRKPVIGFFQCAGRDCLLSPFYFLYAISKICAVWGRSGSGYEIRFSLARLPVLFCFLWAIHSSAEKEKCTLERARHLNVMIIVELMWFILAKYEKKKTSFQ